MEKTLPSKGVAAGAALITGGARRIGKAIATDLAQAGMAVAIHYRGSSQAAETLAQSIVEAGGKAASYNADLTDPNSTRALFDQVHSAFGQVSLLVNNASIFEADTAHAPDIALMDAHFAVHVKAPVLLTAAMAAQSELTDGLVVNIIDQRVWALTPRFFSYTLSKSALWTATRTMAQQFAPKIRVNAIGPGPTLANERQSPGDFDAQIAALLLQRGPELAEFGSTIRFLMANRSITGQMIALDGGQHLAWQTPDTNVVE